MNSADVVIVGAGHGGAQAAIALRQLNFEGTVTIIGDEPDPPYERPPMSKDYLAGEKSFERCLIRPAAFWAERGIDMLLGRRAVTIAPSSKRLHLQDGEPVSYGSMIWAAGGRPRSLSCVGADLAGVCYVRDRVGVDALVTQLERVEQVVVVGGGFIGLETAAVLTKMGKAVVLLEAQKRVLARVAGEAISRFYEAEHRARGVDVRTDVTIERLEGRAGRLTGVRLADGSLLPADIVVVGIGITPGVEPLIAAGATCDMGVHVDESCRTTLDSIYAIGDCAAQANRFTEGRRVRIESVQNATVQAATAASHIMGVDRLSTTLPWFWSDQYDLKLQTIGLLGGFDTSVVRGDPRTRSFSVVYLRRGHVIALDSVNATRDFVQARKLIELQIRIDPAQLADSNVPLKDLTAATGA